MSWELVEVHHRAFRFYPAASEQEEYACTTFVEHDDFLHLNKIDNNMTQRFYFDTSVFGGVYDSEYDETSIQLFEKVKLGQIICVYSDLTEGELYNAPEKVKKFFKNLPKENLEIVHVTDDAVKLAKSYISENVVG